MPTRKVTPLQIAKTGHVVAAMRKALKNKGMTPKDLVSALDGKVTATSIYHWLGGQNAPGPAMRKHVAKVLGLTVKDLIPLRNANSNSPANLPALVKATSPEVFSFSTNTEGTCRIKLDITLPLNHGVPLFRVLLDSGLIHRGDQIHEPAD